MLSTLLLLLLQVQSGAASAGRGTIAGHVVMYGGNAPIGHVHVELAKVGGELQDYRTAVTAGAGAFAFTGLPAGTYRVYAARDGYLRREYGQRAGSASGVPIVVSNSQDESDVFITILPLGVIIGRVLDGSGNPVRHVWVRALQPSYFYGHRSLNMAAYSESDDLGEYRIFGLSPGRYFVSAVEKARPYMEGDSYVVPVMPNHENYNQTEIRTSIEKVLEAGGVDPAEFDRNIPVPTYYPGVTDATYATSINVRPGLEVTGIDLTTTSLPAVHVRGTVVNVITGQRARTVSINLIPRGRSVSKGDQPSRGTIVKGGFFDIAGVPSGSYDLLVQDSSGSGLYSRTAVDVGKEDLANISVVLRPGITITGQVTIDEGRDIAASGVTRFFAQLNEARGNGGGYSVPIKPDGTFTIPNVRNGDYTFRLFPSEGSTTAYVKAARLGAVDALNGIHIDGDAEKRLDVVVALNSGNVDALALDDKDHPVQGVSVAAIPAPPYRNRTDLYHVTVTDAMGHAQFEGLAPGTYKLFAADGIDRNAWEDPETIAEIDGRGEPVQVGENGKYSVTLKLILANR
jgi:Carboxypeptidase regulatory-like domain